MVPMELINVSVELVALGQRLRETRIARGDTQAVFAERLGCSVVTIRAMEKGDPAVGVGWWAKAFWILNRTSELDGLLKQESLFVSYAGRKRQRGKRGNS